MITITIQQPGKSPLHIQTTVKANMVQAITELINTIKLQEALQSIQPDDQYKWFRKSIVQGNIHIEPSSTRYCEQCYADFFPTGKNHKLCEKCGKYTQTYLKKQLYKKAI